MIAFAPLRTRRLDVVLSELSFSNAMHLCELPAVLVESGITQLLDRIVSQSPAALETRVTNPRLWTVQERALVVAHYTAHMIEGDPDFAIGEHGQYSDYTLEGVPDYPTPLDMGDIAGYHWRLHPLLGIHAEVVETLILAGKLKKGRAGWWIGCMAAQLECDGTRTPDLDAVGFGGIERYISDAATLLQEMPNSDLMQLLFAFLNGLPEIDHLFRMALTDDGVVFLPNKDEKGGKALPPARFPVATAIPKATRDLFGNPQK